MGDGRRLARAWDLRGPVALPPAGAVGWGTRARVVAEALVAYVPLTREVRSNDLMAMAAAARRVPGTTDVVAQADAHALAVRLGLIVRGLFDRLPMDSRCLIRSLVLVRMLERRSIASTLSIGVGADGAFSAHAWVEHEGAPLLPVGRMERLIDV